MIWAARGEGERLGTRVPGEVVDEEEEGISPAIWTLPKNRKRGSLAVSSNLCSQFWWSRTLDLPAGPCDGGLTHLDFGMIRSNAEACQPKRHRKQLEQIHPRRLGPWQS